MDGVSFKPQLFTKANKQYQRHPEQTLAGDLLHKLALKNEKVARLKEERDSKLLQDCNNFQPKINPKSALMDKLKFRHGKLDDSPLWSSRRDHRSFDCIQLSSRRLDRSPTSVPVAIGQGEENI